VRIYGDVGTTLRGVEFSVTEIASSLAICTRWNEGSEGGVTQMSKSFLSANFNVDTLDSRGGPTATSLSLLRALSIEAGKIAFNCFPCLLGNVWKE